jgi:predicted ABC-type ATPase
VFSLNHYLNADNIERALVSSGLDLAEFDLQFTFSELCDALRNGHRIPNDHAFFTTAKLEESILYASQGNGYLAASIVDFLREELMRRGASFSYETVMSHRSKVEFFGRARADGYKTYLYFVCTNSVDLNVARVRSRVRAGGHPVPEDKIRDRYFRCLELAREAIANSYRAYIFDNSGPEPIWLAEFDPDGRCELKSEKERLPNWFRTWVYSA